MSWYALRRRVCRPQAPELLPGGAGREVPAELSDIYRCRLRKQERRTPFRSILRAFPRKVPWSSEEVQLNAGGAFSSRSRAV